MYILEKPGDRKGFTASLPLIFNRGLGQGEGEGAEHFFLNFNLLLFLQNVKPKTLFLFFTEELGNIF